MPFTPPRTLQNREIWQNSYYNDLITYLETYLSAIGSADLAVPLQLSRPGQALNGGFHSFLGFKHLAGAAAATPILDVCAYGAVGDYSARDDDNIQAAINALPATGGVVLIPPGIYKLDQTINLSGTDNSRSNVVLMGFGEASRLRISGTFTMPSGIVFVTGGSARSGHALVNLTVDTARDIYAPAMFGVSTSSAADPLIDGVAFRNHYGTALQVNGSSGVKILHCRFENVTDTAIAITGGGSSQVDSVLVEGCRIKTGFLYGISISGTKSARIYGNRITSGQATSAGIGLYADASSSARGVDLIGNLISGVQDGIRLETRA